VRDAVSALNVACMTSTMSGASVCIPTSALAAQGMLIAGGPCPEGSALHNTINQINQMISGF
jgi:hypothetical protein